MATGALIGGSILGLIGNKKSGDAQKDAADRNYRATVDAVEKSREVEAIRERAENAADLALKDANKAFRDANKQKLQNSRQGSAETKKFNQLGKDLAMKNVMLGAAERMEEIRRTVRENDIQQGQAHTMASASGFAAGSSLDSWVDTMTETHRQDVSWMRFANKSQTQLGMADARLQFGMAESERRAQDRNDRLAFTTGRDQFKYYEEQRKADSVMREADRVQREADREYALATGDASRMAAHDGANAGLISGIGGALGGMAGISASHKQFGWGF